MAEAWASYWKDSTYSQKLNAFLVDNLFSEARLQTGFLSYLSAAIVECFRELLLEKRQDLTFETVFSHPSKLDFMREAKTKGYKIYLYYVCLDDPDMNIARVQTRVKMGGHAVAASVIRDRYFRSLENLIPAFELADSAYLINNFHIFLKKKDGETSLVPGETVPSWALKLLVHIGIDHKA
jgi:predicted ABC-type ATPase